MRFELYYPTRPYAVNQQFGGNGEYYQKNGINVIGHNGEDLRAKHGQPVYAAHDGYAYHQIDNSSGCGVIVISKEQFDYQGQQVFFKSIYWHLCDYSKEPKYKSPVLDYQQKHKNKPLEVRRGDLIGYADNTGLSTGDHLHLGLKPMVPGNQADTAKDAADIGYWRNVEQLNGYLGAIDPAPYFNGHYADEKDEPTLIVDAIEDLEAVNPPGKDVVDSVIADLWARFLALFKGIK